MTMTKKKIKSNQTLRKKYCTLEVEEKRSIGLLMVLFLVFMLL